jgi:hypothetical protein
MNVKYIRVWKEMIKILPWLRKTKKLLVEMAINTANITTTPTHSKPSTNGVQI